MSLLRTGNLIQDHSTQDVPKKNYRENVPSIVNLAMHALLGYTLDITCKSTAPVPVRKKE